MKNRRAAATIGRFMGRRTQAAVLLVAVSALAAGIAVNGGSAATRHVLAVPWSGTLDGNGVVAGTAQSCSASWSGKLQFDVAGTTLSGTGSVDITNQACSVKLPTPFVQHVEYTLTGTRSSEKSGDTRFTLFIHGQSISPEGYDPSGFVAHFGQTNEGIPLVLTETGGRIDQTVANTLSIGSGTTVTLNDHFVLRGNCDEDLMNKADREYEQSQSYNENGLEKLNESTKDATRTLGSYTQDFTKEQIVDKILVGATDEFLGEGSVLLVEVGGGAFTLGKIAVDLGDEILPDYLDSRLSAREADAQFNRADATAAKAQADLNAALDQGPCTGSLEDELHRLLREQAYEAQVRKQVDSWYADGTQNLYRVNGELVSEDAAIAAAKAALTGKGRSTQAASGRPPSVKANAKQVETALADVKRALAVHAKARSALARYKQRTGTTASRVKALLARWP